MDVVRRGDYVPLWCKSNFSFLEGASHPEELVAECAKLGISALAVTDRDGVYGSVHAHTEAKHRGIKLIIGSQITVDTGERVVLLVQNREGYRNLCRLISLGRLRSEKGSSSVSVAEVCAHARGLIALLVGVGEKRRGGNGGDGQPADASSAPAGPPRLVVSSSAGTVEAGLPHLDADIVIEALAAGFPDRL
jgi:DNA polymerase III alpha subunit